MKKFIRRAIDFLLSIVQILFKLLIGPIIDERFRKFKNLNQGTQQAILKYLYRNESAPNSYPLSTYGFSNFSQFEEDGILLYIFARIGETNRKVLELGAGSARECMSSNLIINHNWNGFLVDGSEKNKEIAFKFFSQFNNTGILQPKFLVRWIAVENINSICDEFELTGEIDLLSIDIDGNDYWVLKALDKVSPRVIVLEVQNAIPATEIVSRPYLATFNLHDYLGVERSFRGASISAFNFLLESRGYCLVGTNHNGVNAFFVRKDIAAGKLIKVNPSETLRDSYSLHQQKLWPKLSKFPWVRLEPQNDSSE